MRRMMYIGDDGKGKVFTNEREMVEVIKSDKQESDKSLRDDMREWDSKARKRGIFAGHDYERRPPALEAIAAVIHMSWHQYQVDRGMTWGEERTAITHPHLKPWVMMDDEERESTYWSAEYVLKMLGDDFQPSEGFLPNSLACWHHMGWYEGMRANGWRYGEVRDNEAKIHPYLKEWQEVAEANRGMSMCIGRGLFAALPYIRSLMEEGI